MSSFDRVSGFLQPNHFFEPLHGRLVRGHGKLIQAGKHASPITLKTFFDSEPPIGQLTVAQYLGRLGGERDDIINAEAYGRTIYDLAVRRELIIIGEDMVNLAYDLPVDAPPENADRGIRAAAVRSRRQGQIWLWLHGVRRSDRGSRRNGGARL